MDLFQLEHMQILQDRFVQMTGLGLLLADPGGRGFTRPSWEAEFARLDEIPGETVLALCKENASGGNAVLECGGGRWAAGVPVQLDGQYMGSWILGPFRQGEVIFKPEPGSGEYPVLSSALLEDVLGFFVVLSSTVVRLALSNFSMERANNELLDLTDKLELTAQMLTKFTNSAEVAIYVTDFFTGEILMANNKFAEYAGKSEDQLVGVSCWTVMNGEQNSFCPYCPHEKLLDERGGPAPALMVERYFADADKWLRLTHQAIYWVDGRLAHMITFIDITQEKQIQDQLSQLAFYDRDMQLPNSLKLTRDVGDGVESPCCLVCADIRSLRNINDAYSRETGDALLHRVKVWLESAAEEEGILYRVDGDEFCILLRDGGCEAATELAERIRSRFDDPWALVVGGEEIQVFCGVTVGIVEAAEAAGRDDLLNLIERTLDHARRIGGIAIYSEEMDEELRERLRMELSLKRCVREGMRGFQVYYQPVADPVTGMWCGLEALCRWESPEFGAVLPQVFIALAEQMDLINPLGRWIMETAVSCCKGLGLDKLDKFTLDVNISPSQLLDPEMEQNLLELLQRKDYPGSKLCLEITESTEFQFSQGVMNTIRRFRERGILVALDDFGTGYSSFNNLRHLPVSLLKTERAFISDIEGDSYQQFLLYMMVELAHAADMKLIAEGVETQGQMKVLLHSGVDYLQGFLFSQPLTEEELRGKLDLFTRPDEVFGATGLGRVNMSKLLDDQKDYCHTPRTYRMLHDCMRLLLNGKDDDALLGEVLRILGENLRLSRDMVMLRQEDGLFSTALEWTAPGIPSLQGVYQDVDFTRGIKSWVDVIRKEGVVTVTNSAYLNRELVTGLHMVDARAFLAMPLWDGADIQGVIVLTDVAKSRDWPPEEILMLYDLAMIISSNLKRRKLRQEMERQSKLLSNVLNNINMPIYVSTEDNSQLLFANSKTKELFAEEGGVEQFSCWNLVLKEKGHPPFCKLRQMRENPEGEQCLWEAYDWRANRHFRISGSVIPWSGAHQRAHLQYVVDITNVKEYQDKIRRYETMDVQTGVLNHAELLSQLRTLMRNVGEHSVHVALCYVDMDGLSRINSRYGHRKGDRMLEETARLLRSHVGKGDIIGRYGDDEFVFTCIGQDLNEAESRVEQLRSELMYLGLEEGVPYCFSYGVAHSGEDLFQAVAEDAKAWAGRVLEVAALRMRIYRESRRNRNRSAGS